MQILVNDVILHYKKIGQGPPMILLHGNGEDRRITYSAAQLFMNHYTVYCVDSRDHGLSSRVEQLHYRDMAYDMIEFIQQLGLKKPVFCGFSDGGIVGLMVAAARPRLLSRLVVCGVNTKPSQLNLLFWTFIKLSWRITKDPKLKLMLTEPHLTHADLGRIRVPTLVLAGSRDIIHPDDTREIAAAIPSSILHILPGETHGSYVKDGHRLYRIVLPFLTGKI